MHLTICALGPFVHLSTVSCALAFTSLSVHLTNWCGCTMHNSLLLDNLSSRKFVYHPPTCSPASGSAGRSSRRHTARRVRRQSRLPGWPVHQEAGTEWPANQTLSWPRAGTKWGCMSPVAAAQTWTTVVLLSGIRKTRTQFHSMMAMMHWTSPWIWIWTWTFRQASHRIE